MPLAGILSSSSVDLQFFSTVAQVLCTIFAFLGAFVVFQLDRLQNTQRDIFTDMENAGKGYGLVEKFV